MKIKCSDCGSKCSFNKKEKSKRSLEILEKYRLYLCKGCKEDFYHKSLIERGEAERLI